MSERLQRAYALNAELKINRKRLTTEIVRASALGASTLGFFALCFMFEYSTNVPFGSYDWKYAAMEWGSKLIGVTGTVASALSLQDNKIGEARWQRKQLLQTAHNSGFQTHGVFSKRVTA